MSIVQATKENAFKISKFYKKNVRKRKFFIKYAIVAQLILFAINILYLVDYNINRMRNMTSDLSQIFIIVPSFFHVLFMVMYYDAYKNTRKNFNFSKMFPFVTNTIIATNIVYLIICIVDVDSILYYLITAILQVVNTFFFINYTVQDTTSFATGVQQVILKIFVYGATITAAASLYLCFTSIFSAWIAIIINSVLLVISFLLYDNYRKNGKNLKRQ